MNSFNFGNNNPGGNGDPAAQGAYNDIQSKCHVSDCIPCSLQQKRDSD